MRLDRVRPRHRGREGDERAVFLVDPDRPVTEEAEVAVAGLDERLRVPMKHPDVAAVLGRAVDDRALARSGERLDPTLRDPPRFVLRHGATPVRVRRRRAIPPTPGPR